MRVAHRAGGGSVMQITMPGVNRATLNSSVLSFEEPDVPRPVGAVDRAEGEHGFGF
jgi:hypothetical protein